MQDEEVVSSDDLNSPKLGEPDVQWENQNINDENLPTATSGHQVTSMEENETVQSSITPRLRFLDPQLAKQKFNNENVATLTSEDQEEVEKRIASGFRIAKDMSAIDPRYPVLERDEHIRFLRKALVSLPAPVEALDSSQTWICYWIIHALHLLDHRLSDDTYSQMVKFLKRCEHPDGGFGGGIYQDAHLATTYAAINALCEINTVEAYEAIDRTKLLKFLLRVKQPDGSFKMTDSSESDVRGTYCALSVAKLTNIIVPELITNAAHWVASCQTYEGGFGAVPYAEAHGGYTFCAFAALALLGEERSCNISNLLRWLTNRQMRFEGGFQGRTNKLVDSCYSFWQGGVFPLLHHILSKSDSESVSAQNWLFDQTALQEYLLVNCQATHGGMIDKPQKRTDFYHTCYALSGLSVAQHFAGIGKLGKTVIVGDPENEVGVTHPVYNITINAAVSATEYFSNLPIPNCS